MPATRSTTVRIGTRGSTLATRQARLILDALSAAHTGRQFELVEVSTRGDADRKSSLVQLGAGIFVTALEDALAQGRVEMAVHSLKDMPSSVGPNFEIAAVTRREDPREALVNRWSAAFADLPQGARIGTGSPRRMAQLLSIRPDLIVVPMRGNVPTRLSKALEGPGSDYDGAVVAAAGLARLGMLGEVSDFLDPNLFVPAAGQGSLGIEIRAGNAHAREIAVTVADPDATTASEAERSFVTELGGGCSMPLSAYARLQGGSLVLTGFVSNTGGEKAIRQTVIGEPADAAKLGRKLAADMAAAGAREILAEINRE